MSPPVEVEPLTQQIRATVVVPGSKSHTNRALACASLADGPTTLLGALRADDTSAMLSAVSRLGAQVAADEDGTTIEVRPPSGGLATTAVTVDAALSGTTARFALALAATGSEPVLVDGLPPLRSRPMRPTFDALRSLGAEVVEMGEPGRLPVRVTGPARGRRVQVDGSSSSQFVSGLLLAAPGMPEGLAVTLAGRTVSRPYLDLTLGVMADFGIEVARLSDNEFVVPAGRYRGGTHQIEPDASSASYFFAAAAISGGEVTVSGLGDQARQGDVAFVDVLARMGAEVTRTHSSITVRGTGRLHGVEVDMSDISDTAQTLAAVAVFADGPTRVSGIGFTRRKETNRIEAVVTELRRCGVRADEEADGFVVHPGEPKPALIATYDDHRMAMSFALLGLRVAGIRISDPGCVAKTFPGFWEKLASLGSGGNGEAR